MKSYVFLLVSSLAASVIAAPAFSYSVHEKRDLLATSKWAKRDEPLDRRSVVPVNIALAQRNLEHGHDFLMDVSDPESSHYEQHWTPEKVAETFAAEETTVTSVKTWLMSSGIAEERIILSLGRTFIRMNLTIAETESLIKTEYNVFQHKETSKRSLAVDEYSVPEHVRRHIDYISPTVQPLTMTKHIVQKKPEVESLDIAGLPNWVWDLSSGDSYTTRSCIQALYNMPNGTYNHSSLAIAEFQNEAYLKNDLDLYMHNFVSSDCEEEPTIIVLPETSFNTTSNPDTSEGNLDVELGYGLVYPNPIIYYQINETDLDAFFEAVDASFCKAQGVKDHSCGKTQLAHVISISWGSIGEGSPQQIRQCNEYMKLGLLGTSVVFSSGDSGVGGINATAFEVDAQSACPYVTSVGATQLPVGSTYKGAEEAVTTSFASGGGFSNVWPVPDYQKAAMQAYYKNYKPVYNASMYNNSQTVRGYPDIAANGNNIVTFMNGTLYPISGTSASCPIVASLITLINEQRIEKGKTPVGFINPVLYKNPAALNDIVVGSNPGAGTEGFSAVPGWDPVTGLGTPDYERLLKVFMALP